MSPLLFVVLLGLLAGLVLFVIVLGVGALTNLIIDHSSTRRANRRARTGEDLAATPEVEERDGDLMLIAAPSGAAAEAVAEPFRTEAQIAAGVPVVTASPAEEHLGEGGGQAAQVTPAGEAIEAAGASGERKPRRRTFPKRDSEPQVSEAAQPDAIDSPVEAPLAAASERQGEPRQEGKRSRLHFPKLHVAAQGQTPAQEADQAEDAAIAALVEERSATEDGVALVTTEQGSPAAEAEVAEQESVDPFAAVMASLNRR